MNTFELAPPQDDELFTADVGIWSQQKHHFLRRYLHAFIVAMREKRWDSLHYIDMFAGAGIERVVDDDKQPVGLDWGSPLIAAQLPHKFTRLHLVEKEQKRFDALKLRLARFQRPDESQLICGDANKVVDEVVDAIPPGSLSLAFLDPFGLHLHLATIRQIARRQVDLIIFFPDHLDLLRNWKLYFDDPDSNLDMVLGDAPWREAMKRSDPNSRPDMATRLYRQQLQKLGYTHFEYERISRTGGRFLYKLIFCSKAEIGATIWRNVAKMKPDGQTSFGF